jgi:hypothetical protein
MPIIEYETHGDTDLLVRMRGLREVLDHQIRTIVQHAAQVAADEMERHWSHAPHRGGHEGVSIAESIRVSEAVFHPGGVGGGGYWEVHAGPGPDKPEHFEYVWRGTGVFGPSHMPYKSNVGGPMPVPGYGRGFAQSVAGQAPQQEWFAEAQRIAEGVVAEGIQGIRFDAAP